MILPLNRSSQTLFLRQREGIRGTKLRFKRFSVVEDILRPKSVILTIFIFLSYCPSQANTINSLFVLIPSWRKNFNSFTFVSGCATGKVFKATYKGMVYSNVKSASHSWFSVSHSSSRINPRQKTVVFSL